MTQVKKLDLALQGGGAHGAYSWGVIDRLLEDDRIEIEGISGTSAGAMNGVVMADALTRGDKTLARQALKEFWQAVSRAGMASPIRRSPMDVWTGNWSLDRSPGYMAMDIMTRLVSPYQFNPMNINPLRKIVAEHIDFERVRRCEQLKLFVTATNVRSGKQRVFRRQEMSLDAVMASACLPQVFQAVEIDGEAYWDGGYMGNPALFPLMEECSSRDILLVQINPISRETIPTTAAAIMNRLNEITFNSALIKEIRMIALLQHALEEQGIENCYQQALFHRISGEQALEKLSVSSKLNSEWAFLSHLFEHGRAAAERWLDENFAAIGHHSTLDVDSVYLHE
ncbi:patatin-like phospholipase family protein [Vreelandella populi]|uniref:Patatin-like phospholipase family protein n=1 Tax=Vreelandella populi TaxID=2498858 RepID=A0A433LC52_9GAMM|nr:patatin-like phospholipase family protein [Halomonas populi]RUR39238.1 patatin-like phospholipase family protein [Halomonas populi]RUR46350.1 patatin-like phospholipase family protein [Halomonas populi]RUR53144.1 patatin-like phospholipase family protein [Halomonas populi]